MTCNWYLYTIKLYLMLKLRILRQDGKLSYEELEYKYDEVRDKYSKLKQKYIATVRELDLRNAQLQVEHQELSDSIDYAVRIQNAILPPSYFVNECLPESFILYKPKDVVSGDFYFVSKQDNHVTFAAVDCTGHGVPGAMMSVVGFNLLDQAVNKMGIKQPAKILEYLDEGVNQILRQTHDESGVKDGMDLAICTLNLSTGELQYAGAYNPMYYFRQGKLIEIKADKFPIGTNFDGVVDIYTNHTVQLKKGDTIYLFSDGYADQFGGPRDKKYKYKRMREFITKIQPKSMSDQCAALDTEFEQWKKDYEQIDDVVIFGVKV